MDDDYKRRQISALMGGTPEDYQRWKNNTHRKHVEETTIIKGEILSDEERELINNYRKKQKELKELEEQEKSKFITDKMDENNMIGDFYVMNEDDKYPLINLKRIICIFPVTYYDERISYYVCFENSKHIEVDRACVLELKKLTTKHLTWYKYKSGKLIAIDLSKIVKINKCYDDCHVIQISGLEYRYHSNDTPKTTITLHKSIVKSIIDDIR